MTTGVLLMTYGAPRDDDDVPRYLTAVRGGRAAPDELVTEMRRRYAAIGGSPLVRITAAQARALEAELGEGWVVEAGMRFSDPTIPDAGRALVERGATQIVGLVLSPQWSAMLMGGYTRALRDAASSAGVPFAVAGPWYREEGFIEALAERIAEAVVDDGDDLTLLMTAHSLPKRVYEAEGEYIAQLRHTAQLVAWRARLAPERWRWAYQSAGHTHEEWLRPDLKELLPSLAASGCRNVLVVPVQFVADHLEVLYDLDVAAAAEARACGVRYRRIAMPNTQPAFIGALASVVRRTDPYASLLAGEPATNPM